MDLLEPTFGGTNEYKSIRELADTAVVSIQYLNKMLGNISNNTKDTQVENSARANNDPLNVSLIEIDKVLDSALKATGKSEPIDPINM